MTTIITRINFINAVIRWISEFPKSPIGSNSIPSNLTSPKILFELFKILFYPEDFVIRQEDMDIYGIFEKEYDVQFNDTYYKVPIEIENQIKILDILLYNHINLQKKRLVSPKRLKDVDAILEKFNLYKLVIFKDVDSITYLSELIFIIGTFSSKLSTFGLTSLQFLSDADKLSITEYLGINIVDLESKYGGKKNSASCDRTCSEDWDCDVISSISSITGDDSYVDVEYMESILWENRIFENLVYSFITNELSSSK